MFTGSSCGPLQQGPANSHLTAAFWLPVMSISQT